MKGLITGANRFVDTAPVASREARATRVVWAMLQSGKECNEVIVGDLDAEMDGPFHWAVHYRGCLDLHRRMNTGSSRFAASIVHVLRLTVYREALA